MKQVMKDTVMINARFQKSVNLALDLGDMDRVNHYIPTRSSVFILRQYLEQVKYRQGEHATILIGPYGKGKSHLLLVLLALLCSKGEETKKLRKRIIAADPSMEELLEGLPHQEKRFLPVILSSFQGDLNQSFIFALQEALKREGITDLAPESEYTEAVKTVGIWKKDYPDTYVLFLQRLAELEISVDEFLEELSLQKKERLDFFKEIYPLLTSGSVFAPMMQRDALRVYEEVNRALCSQYGYGGIYIIFDEFSKYIEGHEGKHFSRDMKILQDMCELADNKKEQQLYLTFVAHKSIHEYEKGIPPEVIQAFRGVEGRLKEIQFVVSSQNNFELIENAIGKKEGFFTEHIQREMEKSYELPCFFNLFEKEDFGRIVARGCYPLTPVCAYALLQISEKIGQNERTVFTFLAGNEPGSLMRIMEGRDAEELIGIDCVYDYFRNLFRETVDQPFIHKEWLKADYALSRAKTEEEKKIIKAMAIIRMIRRPEELAVQLKPICYALGLKEEVCEEAMKSLTEKKIVTYRKQFANYDFKNNIGIDLEEEIAKEMSRLKKGMNLCGMLNEVSELIYALPKQYNQNCAMTRYFRYEFITYENYMSILDAKVFFEHRFSDGYILALVTDQQVEKEAVFHHLKELGDERLILLLPKERFALQEELLQLAAVRSLMKKEDFIEENKVLRQELDLYEEDIRFEVNERLKGDFMPERGGCHVLHIRKKEPQIRTGMEFTRYLSEICADYYSLAPRINHELLNIQHVQGSYLSARNKVVNSILNEEDLEDYAKGSSPEAMVYRAAFLRTGLAGEGFPLDGGCRKIMEEIEVFFAMGNGKRASFSILYQKLQGRDYGVRRGILPLFLAWKFCLLEGMPVIYLGNKELELSVEVLNNINQYPESYELFIEEEEMNKEQYLKGLEEVFCKDKGRSRYSNRFASIIDGMQKWYRSLPQFTRISNHYPKKMLRGVQGLRRWLKQSELNPREFLFEQLPLAVEAKDLGETGRLIREMKQEMDGHLDREIKAVAVRVREIFYGKEQESLKACLLDWHGRQNGGTKSHVLNKKVKNFMEYLDSLETNDEHEIIAVLSKRLEDIYIEDWNDKLEEDFIKSVEEIRQSVEEISAEASGDTLQEGQREILLKTSEGREIRKCYDADTGDSTSAFLMNMIEEALENFGDSLETNQKVAVLAETLERLLQ